jgi:hypothetical protein
LESFNYENIWTLRLDAKSSVNPSWVGEGAVSVIERKPGEMDTDCDPDENHLSDDQNVKWINYEPWK